MFTGDPPGDWFGVGWVHRFLEKQLDWYCRLQRIGAGIALRPTLVYGPHDDFDPASAHFVPSFIRRVVEREQPIEIWGDGSQSRNLIHAADVASAIVAVLQDRTPGFGAYNVSAPTQQQREGGPDHAGRARSLRRCRDRLSRPIARRARRRSMCRRRRSARATAGGRRCRCVTGWPARSPGTAVQRVRKRSPSLAMRSRQ